MSAQTCANATLVVSKFVVYMLRHSRWSRRVLMRRYVISLPDVRREGMESGEEYVVLASDGLWDVMTNEVRRSHRVA